jgi:hypothetical protein
LQLENVFHDRRGNTQYDFTVQDIHLVFERFILVRGVVAIIKVERDVDVHWFQQVEVVHRLLLRVEGCAHELPYLGGVNRIENLKLCIFGCQP